MKSVQILYRGSQAEPYHINTVKQKDGQLEMLCDCLAGTNGTHCKHRIALLTGDYKNVIYTEKTAQHLKLIASWIPGTKLEAALKGLAEHEKKAQDAAKELKNAKRKLARVMEGK